MSHLNIASFRICYAIPGSRSTFKAERGGEYFALKTNMGSFELGNWQDVSETLSRKPPPSRYICSLQEVGVQDELVYAVAPFLDGYNVHQLLKGIGNQRSVINSQEHVSCICWLVAQFARAADERVFSSFNPSLFDDEGLAPEELFVTTDGNAKVLDPRWTALRRLSSSSESHSLAHMVAYSMPASWREGDVQARSILFALGSILWELLSGYRLFRRESLVATLHRLSEHSVPNLSEINPAVSAALSLFIEQSLSQPTVQGILDFASSLEQFAGLDDKSGAAAVSRLIAQIYPAKAAATIGSPKLSHLEMYLEQQGANWSFIEESTTYVAAPPSSPAPESEDLEWLAEDEVNIAPASFSRRSRMPQSARPQLASAVSPGFRLRRVPTLAALASCAAILTAGVLILAFLELHDAKSINSRLTKATQQLQQASLSGEIAGLSAAPLRWLPRELAFHVQELPNWGSRSAELVEEVPPQPATLEDLHELETPQPSTPVTQATRASSTPPDASTTQSLQVSKQRGDLLLILPDDLSAYVGDKKLGSGRLRTQLPQGYHQIILRSGARTLATLSTQIRAGTLNIIEFPSQPL